MASEALRAAVIGAGPSGFYAAGDLLRAGFAVDLFDRLPTPFGLVRAGVAPDHPQIKRVTRVFEKVAQRPGLRFLGGVEIGADVTVEQLRERYHAIVVACGTPAAKQLGIRGEEAAGSHPATAFVGWYNGHPDHAGHRFDLGVERAVVVGNGNVAIDVARMLVLDPAALASTDVADHALDVLRESAVREVVVLGRRGPEHAAFTTPELLELGELEDVDVVVDPPQLASVDDRAARDPLVQERLEILAGYAARPTRDGARRRIVLRFRRTPLELDLVDGRVRGVRLAAGDGGEELLSCGLLLRSIGYRGTPLPGLPFDEPSGLIPNDGGRVLDDGEVTRGIYVAGWIKRGPSGVIGTNKQCAAETVARILEDRDAGRLNEPVAGPPATWSTANAQVDWAGWSAIDAHEQALGEPAGRPRRKLVLREELHRVARGAVA